MMYSNIGLTCRETLPLSKWPGRKTSRTEMVYNLKLQSNPSGAVRVADYKLLFSHNFKKDHWYNCSRHSQTGDDNAGHLPLDYYDDDDDEDDDEEDEEDGDDDDDEEANYINVESKMEEHHDVVRKFDRWE